MDVFELVAKGQMAELKAALAESPSRAHERNAAGASLLMWAAYVQNPDALALIRAGLPDTDPYEAIILGDVARVKAALADGWDGNKRAPDGFTPLGLAAFFGQGPIFDLLLPLTHDVNAAAANPQRVAALHAATAMRNANMVEKLLRAGAKPDLAQADGFTALHVAAQHGDTMICSLLLLFGADPGLKNAKGQDAIAHARVGKHDWLAERLGRPLNSA